MSTLSTHVLDTALGRPVAGIAVTLERSGKVLGSAVTDTDGRVRDLPAKGVALGEGDYRLTFAVEEYFARERAGTGAFYREIVIQFRIGPRPEHYHVPLLLSRFGYTTYRGS
jgi:5-hydroxyisourate hydrolase